MKFYDVLHGQFDLGIGDNQELIQDLLDCPELQRLRHMRQMNFDVPYIQELGTSKRLPHSIGVAYLAEKLGSQNSISSTDKKALIVAALLHDAAIPPYGHLVEYYLKKQNIEFNHESILEALIQGNYHIGNINHQILPGTSLKVAEKLVKHNVEQETVLDIVKPKGNKQSAISADIDLDNIDNVHRMAILLGFNGVKKNVRDLLSATIIDTDLSLKFHSSAMNKIRKWQDYRQRIYTLIISNPLCVAHNAFQSKVAKEAIRKGIITSKNWFITETEFEENIRNDTALESLGGQLLSGTNYRLVDYIWFKSTGNVPIDDWSNIDEILEPLLPELDNNYEYFFWVEKKLVSRAVNFNTVDGETTKLGKDSVSIFISKVHTNSESTGWKPAPKIDQDLWRKSVEQTVSSILDSWDYTTTYPEKFDGSYFQSSQLELY